MSSRQGHTDTTVNRARALRIRRSLAGVYAAGVAATLAAGVLQLEGGLVTALFAAALVASAGAAFLLFLTVRRLYVRADRALERRLGEARDRSYRLSYQILAVAILVVLAAIYWLGAPSQGDVVWLLFGFVLLVNFAPAAIITWSAPDL